LPAYLSIMPLPTAAPSKRWKEFVMDNNRIEGIARQAKGSIKEAAGKITGNDKLQAEGKAEKLAGQAQEKLGQTKDAVKKAFK
jgi:uncharacterized protein YjbJ (UPF0337 family)